MSSRKMTNEAVHLLAKSAELRLPDRLMLEIQMMTVVSETHTSSPIILKLVCQWSVFSSGRIAISMSLGM